MADEDKAGSENSGGATLGDVMKEAVAEAEATAAAATVAEEAAEAAETAAPAAVPVVETQATPAVKKVDELGRAYATGRRKNAVARVWIKPGPGTVTVNGREGPVYFARPVLQMIIRQPFDVVDRNGQYDIWCTVSGGGLSGQAGAVRHGLSRALTNMEPELRASLKKAGFLTRDSRAVERKKYGKKKARRSFQFSKR